MIHWRTALAFRRLTGFRSGRTRLIVPGMPVRFARNDTVMVPTAEVKVRRMTSRPSVVAVTVQPAALAAPHSAVAFAAPG